MNDKIQLAAMGAEMADRQQPMCMAKRIEELEAQVRVMAELLRDLHEYIGASIPQTISEHYRGCDLLERIDAALASKLPDHIADVSNMVAPEGWQLVPVEPTEEMLDAGYFTNHGANRGIYRAMLAAAPKPEAK